MAQENKIVDTDACLHVLGCLLKKPELADDGRHIIVPEDFPSAFQNMIAKIVINQNRFGMTEITQDIIDNYLSTRPESKAIFDAGNGENWYQEAYAAGDLASFDYYYDKVKKYTLLRQYARMGINVDKYYNPDAIDVIERQAAANNFDNTSIESIAKDFEGQLAEIRRGFVDGTLSDGIVTAGDGIEDTLAMLQATPDYGPPMYGKYINSVTRGFRLGKFYIRSAPTGVGKALPNSTIIPTPNGNKTVGEIKEGDYLFDAFGKPTRVLKVYPQGKKEVWEITFKDNRKAKCCKEHLWSYCTVGQKPYSKVQRKFFTSTTQELSQMELYRKSTGYKIQIPMQKAVQYSTKQYYIKPYSFGLLLGDGSFRYSNENNKAMSYSSEDDILPSMIAQEMDWDYSKNSDYNYSWTFKWKNSTTRHINVWVEEALKDFPELWNTKSETKFIPREYLEGDIEQRFDLLNGLLDSDGSIDKLGRISYWTVSPMLRDNVRELAMSLGFKVTWNTDTHKDSLPLYYLSIYGSPEQKIKLFKLPRKKEKIMSWYNSKKRKEHNDFNPIIKIQKLDYSEEMTCFLVDNEEHLFLMNDFIVTHNTRSMIADCCYSGCTEIWDKTNQQWVSTGEAIPVLFISTELEYDEIHTAMLAFLSGVDEEHILTRKYYMGEEERVQRAIELLKVAPIYISIALDFGTKDIENIIKQHIYKVHIRIVFFDYLHTSMKILEDITRRSGGIRLREDNVLFLFSVNLKQICTEYDICILTSTQLSGDWQTSDTPNQNLIRGARAISDKADIGMIMLDTTQKDKEALAQIVQDSGYEMPNVKLSIYKNRRGKFTQCYLWMNADKSTCRYDPIFCTNYNYEPIPIEDIDITLKMWDDA